MDKLNLNDKTTTSPKTNKASKADKVITEQVDASNDNPTVLVAPSKALNERVQALRVVFEVSPKEAVIEYLVASVEQSGLIIAAIESLIVSSALKKSGFAQSLGTLVAWLKNDHTSYKIAFLASGDDEIKCAKKVWALIESRTKLDSVIGSQLMNAVPFNVATDENSDSGENAIN